MGRVVRMPGDRAVSSGLLGGALALGMLAVAGCGAPPAASDANTPDVSSGGLSLPSGFEPVALPLEDRKKIFAEAHNLRARAVQQANAQIPMDEASLPENDTAAFDKRVADHRALIDAYLAKELPALAARHNISEADLTKIEEEASRLRWLPPEDPVADGSAKD